MVNYLNNHWEPAKYTIFRNDLWADDIHENGFMKANIIEPATIKYLEDIFVNTHSFNDDKGGMFYSVYSRDLAYRKKIHDEIGRALAPYIEKYFHDYKVVLNSFVVKVSGPESEFALHQDTTGLDELKFSPINIWIPLQDVDETNGCLFLMPKSHRFFSPYRSISFPTPFEHIQETVKQYLQPVEMKTGEALIFDNRVIHHSFKNQTGKTRIAIVCGLFPKEAKLVTCYKTEYVLGDKIELIEHEDDFLITYPKFLIDCHARPETGKSLGWINDPYEKISEEEFIQLCKKNNLKKNDTLTSDSSALHLIGEPLSENKNTEPKSVLSSLINFISSK